MGYGKLLKRMNGILLN